MSAGLYKYSINIKLLISLKNLLSFAFSNIQKRPFVGMFPFSQTRLVALKDAEQWLVGLSINKNRKQFKNAYENPQALVCSSKQANKKGNE